MRIERKNDLPTKASFTLVETIVATSLLAMVLLQVVGTQANAMYFAEYGRNAAKAIWLGRRIMDQVEYKWRKYPFKEMETERTRGNFDDDEEFEYEVSIQRWKLPILKMITGGGFGGDEEEEKEKERERERENEQQQNAAGGATEQLLENTLGDDLLRVAHVKVSWPEGASRNDISITYLLTNQKQIDNTLTTYADRAKPCGAK